MITIATSDGKGTYKVQRTLLKNASSWFGAALKPYFTEGQEGILRFPDTPTMVVEASLYWLFHGKLPLHDILEALGFSKPGLKTVSERHVQELAVRIWMFGEQHLVPRLQNEAMRALHHSVAKQYPTLSIVKEAYEGSPPGCVLRKLMLRVVVKGWKRSLTESEKGYYQAPELEALGGVAGFMADFATELGRHIAKVEIRSKDPDKAELYFVSE